jgi:uroporphyrinogen-III synthase
MLSEMASLVERHGGIPCSAPVLQEIYFKDTPEVQHLVNDVCDGVIDAVVLLTGVGTRALIQSAVAMGREEEFVRCLDQRMVIARSPKSARVLRHHNIHIDIMPPEPFTSEDLIRALAATDLNGKVVAVQHYGGPNTYLVRSLKSKGVLLREVKLYKWGLPEDETPARSLIDQLELGKIAAIAFTSSPQVVNLFAIASHVGKEESLRDCLNGEVVVASVGPLCSRQLREHSIKVDVEPVHPHMGNLVMDLVEYFSVERLEVN